VKVFRIHQQTSTTGGLRALDSKESISNLIDELVKSAENWDRYWRDDMSVEDIRLMAIFKN